MNDTNPKERRLINPQQAVAVSIENSARFRSGATAAIKLTIAIIDAADVYNCVFSNGSTGATRSAGDKAHYRALPRRWSAGTSSDTNCVKACTTPATREEELLGSTETTP